MNSIQGSGNLYSTNILRYQNTLPSETTREVPSPSSAFDTTDTLELSKQALSAADGEPQEDDEPGRIVGDYPDPPDWE